MELTEKQGRRKSDSRDPVSMKNTCAWREMEAEGRRKEETASQAFSHGRLSGLSSMTSPWWIHSGHSGLSCPSCACKWFPGWMTPPPFRDWGDPWLLPALREGRGDTGSAPFPPATTVTHRLPRAVSWPHQWCPLWVHPIRAHGFTFAQLP